MLSRSNVVFGRVNCPVRAGAAWPRGDTPGDGRSVVSVIFGRVVLAVGRARGRMCCWRSCLLRRADGVDVIGAALRAKATGSGHRRVARSLGRPDSTVRGWLRAFGRNAEVVRTALTGLLVALDPLTGPLPVRSSVVGDAVEVVGACAAAARRRLGVIGAVSPWQLAAAVTGGRFLVPGLAAMSINTSRPLGNAV
jgi:hypothetical protein